MFDELYKRQTEELEKKKTSGVDIEVKVQITKPGSPEISETFKCVAYSETPKTLLDKLASKKKQVSKMKSDVVVAEIDGSLFDLNRPIEKSCSIDFPLLSFKQVTSQDLSGTADDGAINGLGCILAFLRSSPWFCFGEEVRGNLSRRTSYIKRIFLRR